MHAHVRYVGVRGQLVGIGSSLLTMAGREIKLGSSGLAESAESPRALGGVLSGKSPDFSWW